jgi:hypothetical protein
MVHLSSLSIPVIVYAYHFKIATVINSIIREQMEITSWKKKVSVN